MTDQLVGAPGVPPPPILTPDPSRGSKSFRTGTQRALPPEVTWSRITPTFELFGITRVADVTWLDDVGIPTAVSVRPNAASLSVSQGKGLTTLLAKVSAAMEAIELWHAEQPLDVSVTAPACALDLGYDVTALHAATPSLLDYHTVLPWVTGTRLTDGSPALVPAGYVELSSVVGYRWSPPLFRTTSNGLASGNTAAEATAHGLYEVIERDSVAALHTRPLAQRPVVESDSVPDDGCRWVLERYAARGNHVEIFDATGELDVPCYEVNIWSPGMPLLFNGTGCQLDPGIALSRALTEAAQTRLTAINGTRDDLAAAIYTLAHGQRHGDPEPPPPAPGPRVTFGERTDRSGETFEADLALLARRLRDRRGTEPIVVDLSRAGLPVAVTKVVAPGLEYERGHHEARSRRELP